MASFIRPAEILYIFGLLYRYTLPTKAEYTKSEQKKTEENAAAEEKTYSA